MNKAVAIIAGIAFTVLATGCTATISGSVNSTTPAPSHVSTLTKAQCATQMAQWQHRTHFGSMLTQLASDIRTLPMGSTAGDRAAMRQITVVLASDAVAAEKDVPPACVPGFSVQYEKGLQSLIAANEVAQAGGNASVQQASGNLHAAGLYFQKASRDIVAYTRS